MNIKLNDIIKSAWQVTLQLDRVEDTDNFFVLGGDSLLGTILIASLSEKLAINISLSDLYTNPTLTELLDFISEE